MRAAKLITFGLIISLIAFSVFSLSLDKEIYIQRRAKIMKKMGSGIAIIMSGQPAFRQSWH